MTVLLTTERLQISPLAVGDIPQFVAYRREPAVARYQSWDPGFSTEDAVALVASQPESGIPQPGEWVQLGLRLLLPGQPDRVLIGDIAIGADAVQPATFELGVTLAPDHHGRGLALEGLRAVVDELMRVHAAHRVVMQGDSRNTPVLSLMRRLGLRHEGTILEGDWFKGEWTTLERFALLRREWVAS